LKYEPLYYGHVMQKFRGHALQIKYLLPVANTMEATGNEFQVKGLGVAVLSIHNVEVYSIQIQAWEVA
jgi:hypothetical protein